MGEGRLGELSLTHHYPCAHVVMKNQVASISSPIAKPISYLWRGADNNIWHPHCIISFFVNSRTIIAFSNPCLWEECYFPGKEYSPCLTISNRLEIGQHCPEPGSKSRIVREKRPSSRPRPHNTLTESMVCRNKGIDVSLSICKY